MKKVKSSFPYILALFVTYRIIVMTMPAVSERSSTILNMGSLFFTYLYVINTIGQNKSVSVLLSYIPLFLLVIVDSFWGYFGVDSSVAVLVYKLLQSFIWPLLVCYI